MAFLPLCTSALAACCFLLAPAAGQETGGGGNRRPPPSGGYKGPGDLQPVLPPNAPPPEPPEDGRRFPFGPLHIQPAPDSPTFPGMTGPPAATLGFPPPADTSEWLLWWRLQRWQGFEELSAHLVPRALTPVREGIPAILSGSPAPPADPATLVLPFLLRPLDGDRERPEVRAERLLALARCGAGPQVGGPLREALADDDDRVVEAAALALGILGEPHALPLLAAMVRGDRPRAPNRRHEWTLRQRAFAAYGLGVLATHTRYPALRAAESTPLLRGLPRKSSPGAELSVACCLALGQFPAGDAATLLPELLAVLRDPRRLPPIRSAAAIASARLAARSGIPDLARDALRALGRSLDLASEPAELRQACALGLGRLGTLPQLAVPCAERLLAAPKREADPRTRHLALLGLSEIAAGRQPVAQTRVLPALLAGLQSGTDQDRAWHALALGWAGMRAAATGNPFPPLVAERLTGSFPARNRMRTRAATGLALGLLGADSAAPLLVKALGEVGQDEFQAELTAALALLGRPEDTERVLRHWDALDPFSEGWQAVAAALGRRNPAQLQEALAQLADRPGLNHATASATAAAYGWLRSAEAVAPLLGIARDTTRTLAVRMAALRSLGRIAERPGPRWNAGYLDLLVPAAAPPTLIGTPEQPGVADRP